MIVTSHVKFPLKVSLGAPVESVFLFVCLFVCLFACLLAITLKITWLEIIKKTIRNLPKVTLFFLFMIISAILFSCCKVHDFCEDDLQDDDKCGLALAAIDRRFKYNATTNRCCKHII